MNVIKGRENIYSDNFKAIRTMSLFKETLQIGRSIGNGPLISERSRAIVSEFFKRFEELPEKDRKLIIAIFQKARGEEPLWDPIK